MVLYSYLPKKEPSIYTDRLSRLKKVLSLINSKETPLVIEGIAHSIKSGLDLYITLNKSRQVISMGLTSGTHIDTGIIKVIELETK